MDFIYRAGSKNLSGTGSIFIDFKKTQTSHSHETVLKDVSFSYTNHFLSIEIGKINGSILCNNKNVKANIKLDQNILESRSDDQHTIITAKKDFSLSFEMSLSSQTFKITDQLNADLEILSKNNNSNMTADMSIKLNENISIQDTKISYGNDNSFLSKSIGVSIESNPSHLSGCKMTMVKSKAATIDDDQSPFNSCKKVYVDNPENL